MFLKISSDNNAHALTFHNFEVACDFVHCIYSVATFPMHEFIKCWNCFVVGQVIKHYGHYISVVGTVSRLWAGHPSNRGLNPSTGKMFSVLQHTHTHTHHPASYSTVTAGCIPRLGCKVDHSP